MLDVNFNRYTVDVVSEFTNKRIPEMEYATPYCHPMGKDGVHFMPEPDAEAIVLFPSDGSKPILIGFYMPESEEEGSSGGRPVLNPGDFQVATRSNNHVTVRRGGVVEVHSKPNCQRLYIPVGSLIRDIFNQWEGKSVLGEFSWRHDPIPEDGEFDENSETAVLWTWKCREYVQDEEASIEMRMGHVDDDNYYELKIAPRGGEEQLTYRIGKDGSITLETKGGITKVITGPVSIQTQNSVNWQGAGGASFNADSGGSIVLKAAKFIAQIVGELRLRARSIVLDGDQIKIGSSGASEPAMLGLKTLSWMATHTHPGCGPPVQQATLVKLVSKKVRLE